MTHPHILRLTLTRFRGFENLNWLPTQGMNLILGGGDAGKSTLLEAIALLLYPTNGYTLSDSDYWRRCVEDEFVIEAVMHLPEATGIHQQKALAWPWEWDGSNVALPDIENSSPTDRAAYVLRVRGTSDLELLYEIEQPDKSVISLPTALRRAIGVVKLAGDERSDRDLRLVQGGALDRYLGDKGLRAKLGHSVSQTSVHSSLNDDAKIRLETLDSIFRNATLPTGLSLGFVGAAGLSVNALVGLTAKKDNVNLPILSWGAGTRRLAALSIAASLQDGCPIAAIDEVERGLEPYRQRHLVKELVERKGQSFVTTHSPAVINAAVGAALWYVDAQGAIGSLPIQKVSAQQEKDPEVFLARLAIVAEGITEVGFIHQLLTKFLAPNWEHLGVKITDAGGNESVLKLLEALLSGGVRFGGFADHEPASPNTGRWAKVSGSLGPLLLRWEKGCLEENVIPLFNETELRTLVEDPEGEKTGYRLRTLADRLKISNVSYDEIIEAVDGGSNLQALIIQAAIGAVPDTIDDKSEQKVYKAHAKAWFKSLEGGKELAEKVFALADRSAVAPKLDSFVKALRTELGISE